MGLSWDTKGLQVDLELEGVLDLWKWIGHERIPGLHKVSWTQRNGVWGMWEHLGHTEVSEEVRGSIWGPIEVPGVRGSVWGAQRPLRCLGGPCLGRPEASGVTGGIWRRVEASMGAAAGLRGPE